LYILTVAREKKGFMNHENINNFLMNIITWCNQCQ
jgi:hypothetical protein